jgi:hypothetical protein
MRVFAYINYLNELTLKIQKAKVGPIGKQVGGKRVE